jgi:hypothetical protein
MLPQHPLSRGTVNPGLLAKAFFPSEVKPGNTNDPVSFWLGEPELASGVLAPAASTGWSSQLSKKHAGTLDALLTEIARDELPEHSDGCELIIHVREDDGPPILSVSLSVRVNMENGHPVNASTPATKTILN